MTLASHEHMSNIRLYPKAAHDATRRFFCRAFATSPSFEEFVFLNEATPAAAVVVLLSGTAVLAVAVLHTEASSAVFVEDLPVESVASMASLNKCVRYVGRCFLGSY